MDVGCDRSVRRFWSPPLFNTFFTIKKKHGMIRYGAKPFTCTGSRGETDRMAENTTTVTQAGKLPVKHALILLAVTLAIYLPFIGKPFHVDDPVTYYMARQMTINPLNPPASEYGRHLAVWNFTDLDTGSAFHATPHPPLVPLYLAPVVAVSGDRPWVLHLAMFPFMFACVALMYLIAGLTAPGRELWCAVLFAVSPAVLVNSQQIMLDMPLAAAMMASVYFMLRSSKPSDDLLAGLFAGLACLVKLPAVTLFAVALAAYLPERRWKRMTLFLLPFCMVNGAWVLHNLAVWGKIQMFATGHARFLLGDIRYRFERQISYQGFYGVLPFIIAPVALLAPKTRNIFLTGAVLCGFWSAAMVLVLDYTILQALLYTLSSACGFTIMAGLLYRSFRSPGNRCNRIITVHLYTQLGIGLFLTLYATRYMLPIVFTAIIYWAYLIRSVKRQNSWWVAAAAASLVISVAMSVSDYNIASAERRIAQDVQNHCASTSLFYRGRLGYLYYMHKNGYRDYSVDARLPDSGDLVLRNDFYIDDLPLVSDMNKLEKISEFKYPLFPLTTIGKRAGFYGNDRLPFWVIPRHEYVFTLYRVIAPFEKRL